MSDNIFTKEENELIKDNLHAFIANFGDIRLTREDAGKGVYVFYPSTAETYIQFCYDIDYLNGWLYGAVQAVNRREFKCNYFESKKIADKKKQQILDYIHEEFPEPMSSHFTYGIIENIIDEVFNNTTRNSNPMDIAYKIVDMAIPEENEKDFEAISRILSEKEN